jgi:hypothetical protein
MCNSEILFHFRSCATAKYLLFFICPCTLVKFFPILVFKQVIRFSDITIFNIFVLWCYYIMKEQRKRQQHSSLRGMLKLDIAWNKWTLVHLKGKITNTKTTKVYNFRIKSEKRSIGESSGKFANLFFLYYYSSQSFPTYSVWLSNRTSSI